MCFYYMNLPALGSFHHMGKGRVGKLAQRMKQALGKAGWGTASAGGGGGGAAEQSGRGSQHAKANKDNNNNKKHPENGSE